MLYRCYIIPFPLKTTSPLCSMKTRPPPPLPLRWSRWLTEQVKKKPSVEKREGYAFVTGASQVRTTEKMNGKPCSRVHCLFGSRPRTGQVQFVSTSSVNWHKKLRVIQSLLRTKCAQSHDYGRIKVCCDVEVLLFFPWNIYKHYTDFHSIAQTGHRQNTAVVSPLPVIMYNCNAILLLIAPRIVVLIWSL